MGMCRRKLGKDTRAEIKVDPDIELKDYSGPFKPDLRFTDFGREQLGRMYSLAHHYNYTILRAYRDYIREKWGPEVLLEAQEAVWGKALVGDIHQFITEAMNIKGQDLEAFMKAWQIDLNSQPGDHFEVIFEMPSENRGIVTFNRCPIVEEYEKMGRTDELRDICEKTCPPAMTNVAHRYNTDLVLNVLAMPPRKSKDHICCRFEVCYKNETGKDGRGELDVDPKIDKNRKDIRGELEVNPNVEMQDYSGPFKPDLRITDFSREQLARMYLMAHRYDLAMMIAYQMWIVEKFGYDIVGEMTEDIWGERLIGDVRRLNTTFMNIDPHGIEGFMKAWQMDMTSLPPNFDMKFEMPSVDRGIVTFNTCYGVTMLEPLGMNEELLKLCAMDPPAIGNSARIYHPDMRVKIHAFPPRESEDEVCCKWELFYDATKPTVTWFDGRE